MRAMEHLQLDPLGIMARAQDLMLHSRVVDYRLDDWARLTYERRKFFDWGGWLAARPMEELPHWRVVMRRERESNARVMAMASDHADAIARSSGSYRRRAPRMTKLSWLATEPRTSTATAAGTNVMLSASAAVSASTTVSAIGWNIFPSTPDNAKIGK